MDPAAYFDKSFADHESLLAATRQAAREPLLRLARSCAAALDKGGRIFFFGNGGSAADSQHLAAELAGRFSHERRPLAGLALTTDSSALTAIGNDYGYEHVFERQLRALGRKGDVAIGLSTSGNSANVLAALKAAREMGLTAAGFSGAEGGAMKGLADPLLCVPSRDTARIQEMHITLGHALIGMTEIHLGLGGA